DGRAHHGRLQDPLALGHGPGGHHPRDGRAPGQQQVDGDSRVSRRSAAMIRDSASLPARDGPYGTNPARCMVELLTEMLTMRPPPAASIRGVTSRATRK